MNQQDATGNQHSNTASSTSSSTNIALTFRINPPSTTAAITPTTATTKTPDIPKTPIPTTQPYQGSSLMLHTTTTEQQPHLVMDTSSPTSDDLRNQSAQQSLMLKTYSLVGADYLDCLVDEIRNMTKAQTVMIQQVITMDECQNITERLEKQGIKVNVVSSSSMMMEDSSASSSSSSGDGGTAGPPCKEKGNTTSCSSLERFGKKQRQKLRKHQRRHHLNKPQQDQQDLPHNNQLLITRACSSNLSDVSTSKYCVIPLTLLYDTPPLKTLLDGSFKTSDNIDQDNNNYDNKNNISDGDDDMACHNSSNSDDDQMDCSNNDTWDNNTTTFLPPHKSVVGIRLQGPNSLPLGLLMVYHAEKEDDHWYHDTYQLVSSITTRAMRELVGLRDSERLIKAKNDATQDAENKIKFLADMSHEIRTPMNAVIALTDLLLQERSSLNDEQIEHLDVIQTSGHHLLTVINDILDISKINHDPKFKLETRRFSLRKCIKDALNMARHQASMSQLNKMVYVAECPPDTDDNVSVQQTISSLERQGILPSSSSQYKGKALLPLIWNIDTDVPDYLIGDTMRLTQILLNLCSNAVKFTKKGGIRVRIKQYVPTPINPSNQPSKLKKRYEAKLETIYTRVMQGKETRPSLQQQQQTDGDGATSDNDQDDDDEARPEKTILEICVTDTGIGIPADRLPRLFKSFSQIDISTARRYGGTGLGLAISSTLVNRMGGGLWVESEEGVGSCFALTLPMTIGLGRCFRTYGSESTTASSFITSPPSPSSSISDGSGSINSGVYDRSDTSSSSNFISSSAATQAPGNNNNNNNTSASSSNTGYFPTVSNHLHHHHPYHHQQSTPSGNSIPYRLRQQSSWSPFSTRQQPPPVSTPLSDSAVPDPGTHPLLSSSPTNNSCINNSSTQPTLNPYSSADIIPQATRPPSTSPTPYSKPNIEAKTDQKRPLLRRGDASQTSLHHHPERNNKTVDQNRSSSPSGRNLRNTNTANTANNNNINKNHHPRKKTGAEENFALMYPVKILLAEDNVLNQKIAISILKRLGYHDVVVTNNGKEALDIMRKIKFDVIFMDLYMPEMDGLEATREIISERTGNNNNTNNNNMRRLLNVDDVYIIALTASASNQDRQICIDAGMNDFISKPFTMMEMKASLKTCGTKRAKRRKQRRDQDKMDTDPPGDGTMEIEASGA
ncbi:hypothetical protein BC941DRAFT_419982 [Chlamydoabsidia padenii]|nr:hypothetical protein BC941DRAFT_419982 [Chlamydoabsidia padenii]